MPKLGKFPENWDTLVTLLPSLKTVTWRFGYPPNLEQNDLPEFHLHSAVSAGGRMLSK